MLELFQTAVHWLEAGHDTALAAICSQSGSTPRTVGAAMAVRRDGRIAGTIGGGIVEARTIDACRELLAGREHGGLARFDLEATQAAQAGMICGGRLQVALLRFEAGAEAAGFFRAAVDAMRGAGYAAALLELDGPAPGRYLLVGGEPAEGGAGPPADLLRAALGPWGAPDGPGVAEAGGRRALVLPLAAPSTAVIVGAGHVAQHTARVLAMVGFRTVVMDDRAEFANRERFPEADLILTPAGFQGCLEQAGVDRESYVVILTRGHLHDKTVLAQALRTPAAYVGMIGSRRKRDATYAALLEEGVSPDDLERVHCPIGLDIDAETPEEIALSIGAEMVRARARRRRKGA
jgi:xanthine dehydrogenase accessory factor